MQGFGLKMRERQFDDTFRKVSQMFFLHNVMSSAPRCGSGPKCCLEAPPPSTPLRPETPPPHQPGPPPPGALQKEPRGVGGRGKERAGREGVWLEGRVLQLQWGEGWGSSKHQLGPDPHLGAPNDVFTETFKQCQDKM